MLFRLIITSFLCLSLLWPASPALCATTTLQEERRIARDAMDQVLDQLPLVDDADSVDYLRNLGTILTDNLDNDPFTYHFWLVDAPVLNAFALPAGYIFMFSGMFTALESEDELAGILAHEIAHAHLRHVVKRIDRSKGAQTLTLAGMLAGALLAALGGGAAAGALMIGAAAGGVQSQIAFTREYEEEADYYGYLLMTRSRYSGQGMVGSFQRLWQQERISGGSNVPDYLRTHPASVARMERMEAMLARRPEGPVRSDNHEFLRIKTRLIALYQQDTNAFDLFRSRIRQNPNDYLAHYGLALVEIRRGNYQQAQETIPTLIKLWPEGRPFIDKLQATLYLLNGSFNQAEQTFAQVVRVRPNDREAISGLANSQLKLNRFQEARDNFNKVLRLNPRDDNARYNLGMALGRLNMQNEASAQLGLTFMQRKNNSAAEYHLKRASQALPPGELKEQVDEALERMESNKALTKEERQQLREERIEQEKARRWRTVPPPPWHGES